MTVVFKDRLQTAFERELPPTIVFSLRRFSGLAAMLERVLRFAGNRGHRNSPSMQDEIRI